MVLGARTIGNRSLGDGSVASTVLSGVVWPATATHAVDGEFFLAPSNVWAATATHTVTGEAFVSIGLILRGSASHFIYGELSVTVPPIEGAKRVVIVDTTGASLGVLENAVVGPVNYRLNEWETWGFTMPVTDPKAALVLGSHIREAQIWKGDILLSWGPMVRPTVDDNNLSVQGSGARWHFSRRHVGKANRDNQLCNPSFEDGIGCWNYLHEAYYLNYKPLEDGDVRIYAPGRDGNQALELNADLQPWVSPSYNGPVTSDKSHTVVSGNTLWGLARTYYGSGTQWYRIYNANQAQIQSGAVAAGLWNPKDPGHWIFPGQVFTIPGVASTEVVSAPPEDDGVRWGEIVAFQEFLVNGGPRGLTATLAGWVKVPSAEFTGWGVHSRGVMLQRYKSNFKTNNWWTQNGQPNSWGGYRAFYTDPIESSYEQMGEDYPKDGWIRQECSITVPPNATEYVVARLSSVNGRVYWDKMTLTYDTAFERYDTDQSLIVQGLVEHAQDPAFDKNAINIRTEPAPPSKKRDLVALHSEHANIWDLMRQPTEFRDGIDIGMRYTPSERIVTTHFPKKGVTRRRLHLQLQRNIAAFSWTFDGEAASSSVIILGTGDGSDREEASAIDTAAFASGLILETVIAVSPEVGVDQLQELADEKINVVSNPEVLSITTYPHDPAIPERNFIGRLWEGDTVPVTIRKFHRVEGQPHTILFEVNDEYRVVEMSINEDDSLGLTLNRREA